MFGFRTVYARELRQYFTSPIAYLVAFAFLVLTALIFNNDLTTSLRVKPADPAVVADFLSLALVFFAPVLTMRLLAEEKREGTLELLLTSPVDDGAIVLGKYLAVWTFYTLLVVITFGYQLILVALTSRADLGHGVAATIGIWLYGGAALAVGMVYSASTENQIVAAFLSSATLLLLYFGDAAGQIAPTIQLATVLRNLSFQGHYSSSFSVGIVRLEDITYYAGVVALALFITIRTVESQRWR